MIDISDMTPGAVLAALYNASRPQCDFREDRLFDPRLYDDDNGTGAALRAIEAWRESHPAASKAAG